MNRCFSLILIPALVFVSVETKVSAESDSTSRKIVDLNTARTFPEIKTAGEWKQRAKEIREQTLVSCGLWPLPEKTPLRAKVFGKIERDGYSVEKVYFQTYRGFYLAGNLYRPLGRGNGPFPAVLNPHGHWKEGRLVDTKDASVAARCINFARQGIIAFSYDMVGYHDTRFPDDPTDRPFYEPHRAYATNRTDLLWNVHVMGLQTWNSIRALDFLESLPDVDKKRLGCTGASGGGTQTFMLGAVDDRLAVQAPMVMVSHTMQGGCSCENAPGLRVEYSNMEIAAAAAPRPQLLVSVTGDWTKATLEVEGPAIGKMYELLGAKDRLRYVRFDANHNYNQETREAAYAWFGRWLLDQPDAMSQKEEPFKKEPDADLRVFPNNRLPNDALPREKFIASLKESYRDRWEALVPRNKASVEKFKETMLPAWKRTLQLKEFSPEEDRPTLRTRKKAERIVILTSAEGKDRFGNKLMWKLNGVPCDVFPAVVPAPAVSVSPFTNFFTVYNRTELQESVGFLVKHCVSIKQQVGKLPVILFGLGRAGLWSILAAPAADAVVADCIQLDVTSDEEMLSPYLVCAGIRNIGTFQGAAMLAAPHPLLLHNTGNKFETDAIRATYKALGAEKNLRIESRKLTDDEISDWLSTIK